MAHVDLTINAPPQHVFELITDPKLSKQWMDGVVDIVPATGEPNTVGSTFKQLMKEGNKVTEHDGTILAFEKDKRVQLEVGNPSFALTIEFKLAPRGEGTHLDYSVAYRGKSFAMKLLTLPIAAMSGPMCRKQMAKLKSVAEAPRS